MAHINIPIFVPHSGCPHQCVFCNQKTITGQTRPISVSHAEKIITDHLETVKENDYVEIAFFGGSFTAIDAEMQNTLCALAKKYIDMGKVSTFRCSTRPDCITEQILDNLINYGIGTIELGVQSTDEEVLRLSERGHSRADVFNASKLIKDFGIGLGLQMMTNLPGDTFEKSIRTCEDLISLRPDCVRVYPTLTLEGTKLYDMYTEGSYTPFTLEETVELLSIILERFYEAGIDVIRVGLQTTDEINSTTVTGPYHQAIRELAESRIFRNKLEKTLCKNPSRSFEIYVNPRFISKATGHKRCNIEYFRDKYDINLFIRSDPDISVPLFRVKGITQ